MQRMLFVFLGLACLSFTAQSMTPEETLQFTGGLISGLQTDPTVQGQCAIQLDKELDMVDTLTAQIQQILKLNFDNVQVFLQDVDTFVASLEKISPTCGFDTLVKQVKLLLSPEGKSILFKNYFKNMKAITRDVAALNICDVDYTSCGQSLGNAIKLLVGWSISAAPAPTPNYDFYNGLLAGLSRNGISTCVTLWTSLEPEFTQISVYLAKLEAGNIFVIKTMINYIVKVENQALSWNDQCNYSGLLAIIGGLGTTDGMNQVVTNYLASFTTINTDFLSLGTTCSSPFECGHNLGEGLRLLLGWGI